MRSKTQTKQERNAYRSLVLLRLLLARLQLDELRLDLVHGLQHLRAALSEKQTRNDYQFYQQMIMMPTKRKEERRKRVRARALCARRECGARRFLKRIRNQHSVSVSFSKWQCNDEWPAAVALSSAENEDKLSSRELWGKKNRETCTAFKSSLSCIHHVKHTNT